jgi:hypothetical protein
VTIVTFEIDSLRTLTYCQPIIGERGHSGPYLSTSKLEYKEKVMRSMIRLSVLLIAIAILVCGGFTGVRDIRAYSACDIPKVETIPPGYVFVGYDECNNQDLEIWQDVVTYGVISRPSN